MMRLLSVVLAAMLAAPLAYAQEFPVRPIRIIVPFPPGGGMDGVARPLNVAAKKGRAVLFFNFREDGHYDQDAMHRGSDVIVGEKWLANHCACVCART